MSTLAQLKAGKLQQATRLQISEDLTHFPEEIFTLADTLEVLDLSHNCLSQLPDDFHRLQQLKILFLSNNPFDVFPAVLADCPQLEMIGFKANHIHTVAENSLPLSTRWLILTDNKITQLPESIGQLKHLQKLMLAGNFLSELPASMANCHELQLLRISANQLQTLPDWLLQMPKLAWLAFAGNPPVAVAQKNSSLPVVKLEDFERHELLGEGASGKIYRATDVSSPEQSVALKLFKGEVTSDGYPQDELQASLASGSHASLVDVLAQINDVDQQALVMALIPAHFYNLGLPPTLKTCTQDVYPHDFSLSLSAVYNISSAIAEVLTHLHKRQLNHGDLYAHNILIDDAAKVLLSDFGAASLYASLTPAQQLQLEKIEVRAFGCLLHDLINLCDERNTPALESLVLLQKSCMQHVVVNRPLFSQITICGAAFTAVF